ncbi:MAG: NAD-binding protein [Gemmatimonadetes bacterium]|nr:NAD-binding protein [Gemmatimonadota bacterium]
MLKSFTAQMKSVVSSGRGRRNTRVLARFFVVLLVLITVYSVCFHLLMLREGQDHTWLTGFYWTLTVMSTLGFGDITFHTDLGRVFSMVVLMSGMIFLLVLLPFTFIEFFYEPWMAAQAESRAPRDLPANTRDHVLLTSHDVVTSALIPRLEQHRHPYALVVPELEEALRLSDLGIKVVLGDLDDPETWRRLRVQNAAMVATTRTDVANTSVALTVRQLAEDVPIVASAADEASVDILTLAGTSFVLRLEEMIGQSFATRTLGGDAMSHTIGQFDELLIAEATAARTPLVGRTLKNSGLREHVGVTVVGVWERGRFEPARPDMLIGENTVLVLAGTKEALLQYDESFCIYGPTSAPVLILGGGRVGRSTARALARQDMDFRIVEKVPERVSYPEKTVVGNAADLAILEAAGIRETSTVIITTHDDDMNVYLTIYCRRLRPDVQILSRVRHERNVAPLHRAGADSVLSYASMGVGAIMNLLGGNKIVMVAEGLDLFEAVVPDELAGRTIAECSIRERTGCSVVAVHTPDGMKPVPSPLETLPAGAHIVLIGTADSEARYLESFGGTRPARAVPSDRDPTTAPASQRDLDPADRS